MDYGASGEKQVSNTVLESIPESDYFLPQYYKEHGYKVALQPLRQMLVVTADKCVASFWKRAQVPSLQRQ